MIPILLVAGLLAGRWSVVVLAAGAWPLILLATGTDVEPAVVPGAMALAAANTAVGVVLHQAVRSLLRAGRAARRDRRSRSNAA